MQVSIRQGLYVPLQIRSLHNPAQKGGHFLWLVGPSAWNSLLVAFRNISYTTVLNFISSHVFLVVSFMCVAVFTV